jgi:hypothetical protein
MEIDKLATTRIFCYTNRDSYEWRPPCFSTGVPAIAGISTFSDVTAFAVFFAASSVSNVAGIPVVTGFWWPVFVVAGVPTVAMFLLLLVSLLLRRPCY